MLKAVTQHPDITGVVTGGGLAGAGALMHLNQYNELMTAVTLTLSAIALLLTIGHRLHQFFKDR